MAVEHGIERLRRRAGLQLPQNIGGLGHLDQAGFPYFYEYGKADSFRATHRRTRETYKDVRLHKEFVSTRYFINFWNSKVIQKKMGIICKIHRRYIRTTALGHNCLVAPNLIAKDFTAK